MRLKIYHKVWITVIFIWISIYTVRITLSPALPFIISEFKLSYTEAGIAASVIFYTYTSMQFIAGFLGARFGRKRLLIIGTLLNGFGGFLTAISNSFSQLLLARILTGIGAGLIFSNDRAIVASYTPIEMAGMGQGLSFSGVGIGMTLGILVGGLITVNLGWRWAFIVFSIFAAIPILMAATMFSEPIINKSEDSSSSSIRQLFHNKDYLAVIFGGFPVQYSFWVMATWLPTILIESGQADAALSSGITAILGISVPFGLIVLGRLADMRALKGGDSRAILVYSSLSLSAAILGITMLVIYKAYVFLLAPLIFLASFLIFGIGAVQMRIVSRIVENKNLLPIAFGYLNGVSFLAPIISPYVTGFLRDVTGDFTWGLVLSFMAPLASFILFRYISKKI
ncbi:MAG: MFS transporter [Nitrososphaerota archaeon]